MDYKISKEEFVAANSAVLGIISTNVENIEFTNKIPIIENNADFNKVFKDKVSILFADISKSGNILDTMGTKNKVKVYRSFIRLAVQAIKFSGGKIRQYAGDTIMGVFQDSIENDIHVSSTKKAIIASRYLLTLVDYLLNPLLKKYTEEALIACSIGICTGDIIIAKAGMRNRESNSTGFDLATSWVGSTPYDANQYCMLANGGEIFIDPNTFATISEKSIWEKSIRTKNDKLIGGFVSKNYYLDFLEPLNILPITAQQDKPFYEDITMQLFKQTKESYISIIDELTKRSSEITQKTSENNLKEKVLNERENLLNKRELELNNGYLLEEYKAKYSIINLANTKFKVEQIVLFGKDFWIDIINRLEKILKTTSNSTFNGVESWNISRIYLAFKMYDKYYDAVCNMAKNGFPIWESEISIIKERSFYRSELIEILKNYIKNNKATKQTEEYKRLIKILES